MRRVKRCNFLKQQVVILDDLFRGGSCGDFFFVSDRGPIPAPARIRQRDSVSSSINHRVATFFREDRQSKLRDTDMWCSYIPQHQTTYDEP